MEALLLTILLIAIGWYFIVRPQQVRLREQREMVRSLEVGDRVITAGGFFGTLTAVDEETVVIRIAPDVEATLARPAISRRLDDEHPETHSDRPRPEEGPDVAHPDLGDDGAQR